MKERNSLSIDRLLFQLFSFEPFQACLRLVQICERKRKKKKILLFLCDLLVVTLCHIMPLRLQLHFRKRNFPFCVISCDFVKFLRTKFVLQIIIFVKIIWVNYCRLKFHYNF